MVKIKQIFINNLYAVSLYSRQAAGSIVLFLIARYLLIHDYGLFTSYKNITAFLLIFTNLGFNEYILISSNKNIKEVSNKIVLFILNSLLIILFYSILSFFFNIENHLLFILILIKNFFDSTVFALFLPYFQITKKFTQIANINMMYSVGIVLIAIISFAFNLSLINFLLLNIILGIINLIHCSFSAKLKYLFVINNVKCFIKKIDKRIIAFIVTTLAYYLYSQIPSLYVSFYLTKEQAAIYFAAFTVSSIISLFIVALNQKIMPDLISKSCVEIKTILKKNIIYTIIVNLFLLFLFIIFGKKILYLIYGQLYYTNAYIPLLILTFKNIIIALACIYGSFMLARGYQKNKFKHQIIATLIAIIYISIFYKYHIYTACMTSLFSAFYVFLSFFIYYKKISKNDLNF